MFHKTTILLLTSFFFLGTLSSQVIKTKDGIPLGDKEELIKSCFESATQKTVDLNGMKVDAYKYCSCVTEELYPRLTWDELETAVDENTLEELLFNDENFKIIMDCAEENVELSDEYKFGSGDSDNIELEKRLAVKECVNIILEDTATKDLFTEEIATSYCQCAVDELYSRGLSYGELMTIEDESSEVFNEIAVPCLTAAFDEDLESKGSVIFNSYDKKDIKGKEDMTRVELVDYLGQGYKVKIEIDGVVKYFLFDTGASDMIISTDLERELLLNGSIKEKDYLDVVENYTMANNEIVEARVLRLDKIKIGDYEVDNVLVGVMDDGSLLCGKGFLDKFSNWELLSDEKVLVLYK